MCQERLLCYLDLKNSKEVIMSLTPDLDPADFMLGQKLIDDEHAELISLINALKNGAIPAIELLHHLQHYAQSHFEGEEELMLLSAYPDTEPHMTRHREFRTYLATVAEQIQQDQNQIPSETQHYLEQWILHHIRETDRLLVDFLLHEEWL
jgi:hemerythrin-like metal-binding protein